MKFKRSFDAQYTSPTGKVFIWLQIILLLLTAAIYVQLHILFPANETLLRGEELVHLDPAGRATLVSAHDMDWYVGHEKSVPLLAQLDAGNKAIERHAGALRQQVRDFASQFSEEAARRMRVDIELGRFNAAAARVADFRSTLAPGSLAGGVDRLLNQTEETLREAADIRESQRQIVALLRPPHRFVLFWANPVGLVAEVAAWSLFGLFASLLYHTAEASRRHQFRSEETFVGWTKLFYTPIVAIVLVLAIAQGLLHIGTMETRVWVIPLLGFLAGFNSRKAASVIDGFCEFVLTRIRENLGTSDSQASVGAAAIARALPRPRNFDELASNAKVELDRTITQAFRETRRSN